MAAWVAVGRVGDTAPGSGKVIVLGERRLALFDDDGEYRVLDDACPHQGASLGEGSSFRGTVVCPWHSWSFDLKSGVCPEAPSFQVRSYPVRVVDGTIEADLT